jgi:hypothetical protein
MGTPQNQPTLIYSTPEPDPEPANTFTKLEMLIISRENYLSLSTQMQIVRIRNWLDPNST